MARVAADLLGGEQPRMAFEGPSPDFLRDKVGFEAARRERWFKSG